MLTPEELEHCSDDAVELYAVIENALIRDIIKRVFETGEISSTSQLRIIAARELGVSYNELVKIVSQYTNKSEEVIRESFENACIKSIEYDNEIYRRAGLNPALLKQSPNMLQVLDATINKTNGQFQNLTLSLIDSSQKIFLNTLNQVYLKTITGAFSYYEAVRQAIEEISKNGLYVEYPSGRKDHVDVAVKRAVRTGISQTTGMLQEMRAKEMGCEYYEVSAHVGARNTGTGYCNHESWQGKVYKINGATKEYANFYTTTGYRKIQGLCGINCRHSFFPFFPGISKRAYTDKELEQYSEKTVTYNGKTIKKYQAEQMQRGMERELRDLRRIISSYSQAYKSCKSENEKEYYNNLLNNAKIKLIKQDKLLKDFISQTK